jgi:heptosyltransferase III
MPEASEHIIISRTDSIGDVMLTLPVAGALKQRFPNSYITFLGRGYTRPVLECCAHVDRVLTLEELTANGDRGAVEVLRSSHADAIVHVFPVLRIAKWAHDAGIDHRIGTSRRWWHWLYCNHRPAFSRRKSDLHEAMLNMKLLAPFGIVNEIDTAELVRLTGFQAPPPDATVRELLVSGRRTVILHPMSSGSAVEWGLDRFAELMHLIHPAQFQIILTGTAIEAERYREKLPVKLPNVTDAGGQLDLRQLISLIGRSHALVAASTGPLHIAAACGIRAIGLYANVRPIHPGRWAPLGTDAHALYKEDSDTQDPQEMIHDIGPGDVLRSLESMA